MSVVMNIQSSGRCWGPEGVYVDPGWYPIRGDHNIIITPRTVESWTQAHPRNSSTATRRTCVEYSTPEQMVKAVQDIMQEGLGAAWK